MLKLSVVGDVLLLVFPLLSPSYLAKMRKRAYTKDAASGEQPQIMQDVDTL